MKLKNNKNTVARNAAATQHKAGSGVRTNMKALTRSWGWQAYSRRVFIIRWEGRQKLGKKYKRGLKFRKGIKKRDEAEWKKNQW